MQRSILQLHWMTYTECYKSKYVTYAVSTQGHYISTVDTCLRVDLGQVLIYSSACVTDTDLSCSLIHIF